MITTNLKISSRMYEELGHVWTWEHAGYLGCPARLIPICTRIALDRRGLIEHNIDASYKLTQAGLATLKNLFERR